MDSPQTPHSPLQQKNLHQIFFKQHDDFLQLMLDVEEQNGQQQTRTNKYLTREEIEAQALFFFLAGFETVSSSISFLAYCLATNQACQRKLRDEIDAIILKYVSFNSGTF